MRFRNYTIFHILDFKVDIIKAYHPGKKKGKKKSNSLIDDIGSLELGQYGTVE